MFRFLGQCWRFFRHGMFEEPVIHDFRYKPYAYTVSTKEDGTHVAYGYSEAVLRGDYLVFGKNGKWLITEVTFPNNDPTEWEAIIEWRP